MSKNYTNLDFSSWEIGKSTSPIMHSYCITDIKDRLWTKDGEQTLRLKDLDEFKVSFYSIDDVDPID